MLKTAMTRSGFARLLAVAALLLLAREEALAVNTRFWRADDFKAFSEGQLHLLSLSQSGTLSLAPSMHEVLDTGQVLVWSAARDAAGNVYLATGHQGRIYRLTPAMLRSKHPVSARKALYYQAPEPEVFALAVGPDGDLYAGTSPSGKIYRINAHRQSSVYFNPKTRYIWSLLWHKGALYAGTGDNGEIFRISAPAKGEVLFRTGQRQVMSLAAGPQGNILAGTDPSGLIFRVSPQGKGFVIYQAPLPEIHQLAVAADGDIYATAQGASHATPAPAAPLPATLATTAVGQKQPVVLQSAGAAPDGPRGTPAATTLTVGAPVIRLPVLAHPAVMPAAAPQSAVYRITPQGSVQRLWVSATESADDVVPTNGGVLFSTDASGRVYHLNQALESRVLVQTNQEETTRLLPLGPQLLATTANLGRVYVIGDRPAPRGWFESPVQDAGTISHWGHLSWTAEVPKGAQLSFVTRSGNSARPDATWSPWSKPIQVSGGAIASPPARYLQYRALLSAGKHDGASPRLQRVVIPYLPANRPPEISQINVTAAPQPPQGPKVNAPAIELSWTASDPDHDHLLYDVYFRGIHQTQWHLLKRNFAETSLRVGSDLLPDGTYRFKLVASDAPDNPLPLALTAEAVSAPAVLDTTPPEVRNSGVEVTNGAAVIHFSATDATSLLTRAEYVIDSGAWRDLYSDSGIIDSAHETFTIPIRGLSPGEHLVVLRVYDSAGNRGTGKAYVSLPGTSTKR